MTSYSGVVGESVRKVHIRQQVSARIERRSVFGLNLALMIAAIFSIALYIFISNFLVAQRYALDARKSQFNQLNAKPSVGNDYDTASDLKVLLLFAQRSGMVEAKDIDTILKRDNFATLP